MNTGGKPVCEVYWLGQVDYDVDVQGVTRHGFALNVAPDRSYWDGIIACGLDGVQMADLADFFDPPPPVEQVARAVADSFSSVFGMELAWCDSGPLLG